MVEIEQPAQARAAPQGVRGCIVVGELRIWSDELATDALVVALRVVVRDEFAEQVAQVPFAKDHEVFFTVLTNLSACGLQFGLARSRRIQIEEASPTPL